MALTEKYDAKINFIKKPNSSISCGHEWNEKVLNAINEKTKVVSMGVVHWADGTIFNMKKIRAKTRKVGAMLIIDGTQSVGTMPFDIKEIQPDALVCAAYKWLMGPYGFGVAYYGERFDNGNPIEESWINRKGSENFSQLINYQDEYGSGARDFQWANRAILLMLKCFPLV